jgi:NhaP-type Na+/H+ or K+/H+ antiporter
MGRPEGRPLQVKQVRVSSGTRRLTDSTADVFISDSLVSLYLGVTIGVLGYFLLKNFWQLPAKKSPHSEPEPRKA